jgi:integrase
MQAKPKTHPGIRVRHRKACKSREGGRCNCDPSYEAWAYSAREDRKLRKTFPTLAAAKAWRSDASRELRLGMRRAAPAPTLLDAAAGFMTRARAGEIRNRSGYKYKPSALRGYDDVLRLRVLPALGAHRLSDIATADLQRFVARLQRDCLSASTIRNTIVPLRAIYREALRYGDVATNPTRGLALPAVRGTRDRIATATEAAALLAALADRDRALWATAMYAGLRRGELQALDWTHVNLNANTIRVSRAWDRVEGFIDPKSEKGKRTVPIAAALSRHLREHKLSQGRGGRALVFGPASDKPFVASTIADRAAKAWETAGLEAIGLHECRHTYASLMIAAGVNAKTLSTFMGHASITITLDRYGHLFPGSEGEAGQLLDKYLIRSQATP